MRIRRLDIKLSYQCNNHCLFCVQGDKRSRIPAKTSSAITRILRENKKFCQEVVLTGGEITIRPDIVDLVRQAARMGYRIHLQTNGRMLAYEDFCLKLIDAGAHHFTIALHGPDEKTHDLLTRSPGSYRQTVDAIKNLVRLRQNVHTNTVITKSNHKRLPDLARFLVRLGVSGFILSYPHILGSARKNVGKVVAKKSLVAPFVQKALSIGAKEGLNPCVEAIPPCFLGPFFDSCVERMVDRDLMLYDEKMLTDFNEWRSRKGRIKGPSCGPCLFAAWCEGPWTEYPELFGWSEFKPVIKTGGRTC